MRVFTLVDVLAVVAIAGVSLATGAEVAAQGVGAVGEDVARPVLALVVVGHVAALAAVAIVTVALAVQAGAVLALPAGSVPAVACRKKDIQVKLGTITALKCQPIFMC